MSIIIPANSAVGGGGFNVDNSVRFDGTSGYLTRTPSSASDRKTWTWSAWVKRSSLSTGNQVLFLAREGSFPEKIQFNSSDQLEYDHDIAGTDYTVRSDMLFRDTSAWYHIVVAKDTTQSTETDRLLFYANGQGLSTTEFQLGYPPQNYNGAINNTVVHVKGSDGTGYEYFSGYMSEAVLINAAQLAPTSFGEFDEDSGVWKPIDVSGLTFGTNGFHLDFENSSELGTDVSGNSNTFAENNLTTIDQSTDTCTNNFATMNPLDVPASNQPTFSEGNLKVTSASAGGTANFGGASTFAVSSGKWYVEAKATVGAGGYSRNRIGITGNESTARLNNSLGANSYEYFYDSEAGNSNAGSYGDSYTTGDIIGIALNLDDNELKFYKNGTVQDSGTAISITASSSTSIGGYKITQGDSSGVSGATSTFEFNFGSPPYTISSGNTDGNDRGNFEYAPPSGFLSLCTANLSEVLG